MTMPADADPHRLERFVAAQAPVWATVLEELRQGCKRSHWMWFVFPQLRGLGHSPMAQQFGIASIAEARAYLSHPLLGPRLSGCIELLLAAEPGRSARQILGAPDDLKLHSCMTLFAQAAPEHQEFQRGLHRFFAGTPDAATLRMLGLA